MRKLRIVLSENKKLIKEASYFTGRAFQIHKKLEETLQTKKPDVFRDIQGVAAYTSGHPASSDTEDYNKVGTIINNLDSALGGTTFTKELNEFQNVNLFMNTLGETRDYANTFAEFYRATILPFYTDELLNDTKRYYNLIQTVDNLFGRQLKLTLQTIDGYTKKLNAGEGEPDWKKFFVSASEKQKKELVTLIAKALGSFMSNIVQYKISSERYANILIKQLEGGAEGSSTTTTPTTTTPTPPEGAGGAGGGGGGGGEPPPEGAGGAGGERPPAGPPTTSREIPVSTDLYRALSASVPRWATASILRTLRAEFERAGIPVRESLDLSNRNLTAYDILLNEQINIFLLNEGAEDNKTDARRAFLKRFNNANTKEEYEKIKNDLDSNRFSKELYREQGIKGVIQAAELRIKNSTPAKEDTPTTTTEPSAPEKEDSPPSSPEGNVDYYQKYIVDEAKSQDWEGKIDDIIKKGIKFDKKSFKDEKGVAGGKEESVGGQEISGGIELALRKYAVLLSLARKKVEAEVSKKAGKKLEISSPEFDKDFKEKYGDLIQKVQHVTKMVQGNYQDKTSSREITDPRAVEIHVAGAFPEELGFTPSFIKTIKAMMGEVAKKIQEPEKREYLKGRSAGLVKSGPKGTKQLDSKNLTKLIDTLQPNEKKGEKPLNAQTKQAAINILRKFLSNYGVKLAESQVLRIVNNLIVESNKHKNVLREYREHVESNLLPYMQKQIGFNRPPTINFIDDPINAQSPFAKTAYYDPQSMEITVYTTDRHPKDIMRSVAHEVIHHAQNCRGQLDPQRMGEASEGYAQKNPYLRKLEEEAYLLGNMTFRDWEDGMKNKQLNEAHDCNKVHPNKSHAAYKRDDEAKKQEKPLDEWINEERWDLLMKRFKIVSEKRFANDPKLDKDGDGKPKWADEDDDEAEVNEKKLSKSETKEKEKIVKGMKKSKEDFEERYPGRGKEVMYATATKKAMEKK
ncbi:MAG: hypothetical protein RIR47_78 [Bacteroidota bacterium]|jgi:hypothetical protein